MKPVKIFVIVIALLLGITTLFNGTSFSPGTYDIQETQTQKIDD